MDSVYLEKILSKNLINYLTLGEECSKIACNFAKKTESNRCFGFGSQAKIPAGYYANVLNFGELKLAITSDGIGTKVEVAERMNIFNTLGFDLVAMVADDLICVGATPTNISNILDVDTLDKTIVTELMQGLSSAAKIAKLIISGGEIASLGNRIGGYSTKMHFNWGATAIGYIEQNQQINSLNIKHGDIILAIQSRGLRSNGFSLAQQICYNAFGNNWHNTLYKADLSWGKQLLTPSLIYSPLITKLFAKDIPIHGIVHVTGGGIARNLARVLKHHRLGAKLSNLFPAHEFMLSLQALGNISDQEAYATWNMGNGMLLILAAEHVQQILAVAKEHALYNIQVAGSVVEQPAIYIESKQHAINLKYAYEQ